MLAHSDVSQTVNTKSSCLNKARIYHQKILILRSRAVRALLSYKEIYNIIVIVPINTILLWYVIAFRLIVTLCSCILAFNICYEHRINHRQP